MRTIVFKLGTVCLMFFILIGGAGCLDDDLTDENYPFKLEYHVQNENDERVTQVKEGNKFRIYFSIENITDKHAAIDAHHLFFNDELFNIYKDGANKVVGTPVKRNECLTVMGCVGQPHIKNEIQVNYPIKNDTTIGFMCCSYDFSALNELEIGKYEIRYSGSIAYFYISDDSQVEEHETDNFNLKYQFEIVK